MKNNHVSHAPWMMRVSLMLLFMAFSVQWSFAQLDLNVSRTTLGKVIEQIKSQSSYNFFYDDKLASLSVENVKLSNASIEKVLDAVLKGKNIAFKIEGCAGTDPRHYRRQEGWSLHSLPPSGAGRHCSIL